MIRLVLCLLLLTIFSCCSKKKVDDQQITSLNIIDRNGLSETISSKERLENFQEVNFLQPQPYQKVLRVFGKRADGAVHSCITSYHPNGQLRQCLEAVNGRALGTYREWHSNGRLKLEANILGGVADINTAAEKSWLFDGLARAWNEEGVLLAEIFYLKGELNGLSQYYYPCGAIWKKEPHLKGQLHGAVEVYSTHGECLEKTHFSMGVKEGEAKRFWSDGKEAYRECYCKGLLEEGFYYNEMGELIAEIHSGCGKRAVFEKEGEKLLEEYANGVQEGKVDIFRRDGTLVRSYVLKNGIKNGEEVIYFPLNCKPLLSIRWVCGVIQGIVKTWYDNGKLESQREMSFNKKNGMSSAWYHNGQLMFLEEYRNDVLVNGEYFRRGDRVPVSKIMGGKGVATLFDEEGHFLRKVSYREGRPLDE